MKILSVEKFRGTVNLTISTSRAVYDECANNPPHFAEALGRALITTIQEHENPKVDKNEQADLKLLGVAFFDNLKYDDGIGLDWKRPFGNSDIANDILAILNHKPEGGDDYWSNEQREYAFNLYRNKLIPYLKTKFTPRVTE